MPVDIYPFGTNIQIYLSKILVSLGFIYSFAFVHSLRAANFNGRSINTYIGLVYLCSALCLGICDTHTNIFYFRIRRRNSLSSPAQYTLYFTSVESQSRKEKKRKENLSKQRKVFFFFFLKKLFSFARFPCRSDSWQLRHHFVIFLLLAISRVFLRVCVWVCVFAVCCRSL